jgi:3-oxoadipate CoA-transferase alpha subunit
MIDKVVPSLEAAVAGIADGATILVGGFGDAGVPMGLVEALVAAGPRDLTIVSNNTGTGEHGLALLFRERRVRRALASFPNSSGNHHFQAAYDAGEVELELVPQGTLGLRIRAGGAGLGGFFTPTAVGTELAAGRETREIGGRTHVLELPIRGDVALVRAHAADRLGNQRYRLASRNFNAVMATAADLAIAEVDEIVAAGAMPPDDVHTPGIFIDRVVRGRGRGGDTDG